MIINYFYKLNDLIFYMIIHYCKLDIKSSNKMFANDVKLIVIGNVKNDTTVPLWENVLLLQFNPPKCKILHVNIHENPNLSYTVDEIDLDSCDNDQGKYLGVITSAFMIWSDQINASICKANKIIFWIARNVILRDRKTILAIYKALLRPYIVAEFGNRNLILSLEGVQRRFTRLINEIGTLPYSQRLDSLNLTTLAERRNRGDLIEAYKAVNGNSSIGNLLNIGRSGIHLVSDIRASKGSSKVQHLSRNFLPNRVINVWNKLPNNVKLSRSVNSFKVNLNEYKASNGINGNFWDVSYDVVSRIEGRGYLENKASHNAYLKRTPFAARKKFLNLYSTGEYL